jgi:hypothetical protein
MFGAFENVSWGGSKERWVQGMWTGVALEHPTLSLLKSWDDQLTVLICDSLQNVHSIIVQFQIWAAAEESVKGHFLKPGPELLETGENKLQNFWSFFCFNAWLSFGNEQCLE